MNDQAQPSVQILKLYLKDCSVESPNAPAVFQQSGETKLNIDLDVGNTKLDEATWEVVLTLRATAMLEENTLFLVELKKAALIQLRGLKDEELEPALEIWAPTQIYPYAREIVTAMTGHAGFPPVVLPLVNFEAHYQSRKQQAGGEPPAPAPTVQ